MRTAIVRSPRPRTPRQPRDLMRGRAVGAQEVTVRLDPLPEPAWAQWRDVSVPGPGGSSLRVAAVVLGPTGVYVVTRQESSDLVGSVLRTRMASEAAQSVRSALPGRYRGAVSAMLMLETQNAHDARHDAHHDGVLVDEVVVATSPALVEAVRARPRVLSRSEAAAISSVLAQMFRPQRPGTGRRAILGAGSRAQDARPGAPLDLPPASPPELAQLAGPGCVSYTWDPTPTTQHPASIRFGVCQVDAQESGWP